MFNNPGAYFIAVANAAQLLPMVSQALPMLSQSLAMTVKKKTFHPCEDKDSERRGSLEQNAILGHLFVKGGN